MLNFREKSARRLTSRKSAKPTPVNRSRTPYRAATDAAQERRWPAASVASYCACTVAAAVSTSAAANTSHVAKRTRTGTRRRKRRRRLGQYSPLRFIARMVREPADASGRTRPVALLWDLGSFGRWNCAAMRRLSVATTCSTDPPPRINGRRRRLRMAMPPGAARAVDRVACLRPYCSRYLWASRLRSLHRGLPSSKKSSQVWRCGRYPP
jgi:hypothetical protein